MVLAHPAVYLGVNTVLLLAVFTVNSILYVLTWRRIRQEACSIQLSVGRSQLVAASHVAAKNCMLFVIAFVLQVSGGVIGGPAAKEKREERNGWSVIGKSDRFRQLVGVIV